MKPFLGLLKKEMLISRFWFITYLIVLILALGAASYFSNRWVEPTMMLPLYIMLLPLHLVFMPIAVYSLLRTEGKTQIWLYNPQSSVKLLLAKITIAFIFQLISQIVITIVGFLLIKNTFGIDIIEKLPRTDILLTNAVLIFIALYITVWVVFYWTVYHSLGRFPALKNFRWLVVALLMFAFNTIEALVMKMKIAEKYLSQWSWKVNATLGVSYEHKTGWEITQESIPIPIVPIILYTVLALMLFFAAIRLLDKKVEV